MVSASSASFPWLAWPLPAAKAEADQMERYMLVWSLRGWEPLEGSR